PEPEPEIVPEPEPEPQPKPEPTPQPEVKEPEPQVDAPESDRRTEEVSENTAEEENLNQEVELTAGESSDVDRYLTELSRHLGRYYEYPRRARRLGQEGAPVVVFEFSRDGTLVNHSLHASSNHALLDDAALDMLKDAEPLPEVPDSMKGQTFTYVLPVRFRLR
ncbi:MAG: energy transducer TonB, partial [Marinobacter sp.]